MKKEIINYWPIEKMVPRKNQLKTLSWLSNQTDFKNVILELPVGSGKSILALTWSKYLSDGLGNSFILTPQKILQTQYENDFMHLSNNFLYSLYGKSNYPCYLKNTSCNVGSIIKPKCDNCTFTLAKNKAIKSHNLVLNYKLALTSFKYTQVFEKRELMIMDEAHTVERHLIDFDTVSITYSRCKKYGINFKVFKNVREAVKWIKTEYFKVLEKIFEDLDNEVYYIKQSSNLTKAEINTIEEHNKLGEHLEKVLSIISKDLKYIEENYVLVWDKTFFSFKRLFANHSFNTILKPKANKFLFMSSTILDKERFCNDLGIKNEETAFLSLDSEFPVENRPIYFMPVMKMNATWNKDENEYKRKDMLNAIIKLLDLHKNESGILHVANYQIAEWLLKNLKNKIDHNIYHHNEIDDIKIERNDAIKKFIKDKKPSILISPSSTEGLDLKDDLARFAIIVKVPFGYLGDQWIKKRLDISKEWYLRMAMIDIIQGGGRVVRSETDKGTVYILDESFDYLYRQMNKHIPKWWKKSLQYL